MFSTSARAMKTDAKYKLFQFIRYKYVRTYLCIVLKVLVQTKRIFVLTVFIPFYQSRSNVTYLNEIFIYNEILL